MHDDVVRLDYVHGHTEIVDFQFFCDLDDGIDTSLCDWWLSDPQFFQDYEKLKKWREVTEDSIKWDLIDSGKLGTMMEQSKSFLRRKDYHMMRRRTTYWLDMRTRR